MAPEEYRWEIQEQEHLTQNGSWRIQVRDTGTRTPNSEWPLRNTGERSYLFIYLRVAAYDEGQRWQYKEEVAAHLPQVGRRNKVEYRGAS